jgi:hypothetical protein
VPLLLKIRIRRVLALLIVVSAGLLGCGTQSSAPAANRDDDSASARTSERHESRKEERREERRDERRDEHRAGGRERADQPASTSSSASAIPTGDRYDLERDEQRGGHTVAKHVARTDDQLRERLDRERNISAASSWTDLPTAEQTVATALRANQNRIAEWQQRGYPRANLALHFNAGRVVGRSLRHGADQAVDVSQAVVVLRADGPASFFVLTTYPEEGRE